MASRRPLVNDAGSFKELPSGDTVPASLIGVTPSGSLSSSNAADAFNELQGDINSTISSIASVAAAASADLAAHASDTTTHGATGAVVGTTNTQTLTNKTLTDPVISSIVNTGTLTLPTSTDTLVGRATTDTLTNKTLTSPVLGGTITGTYTLGGTPTFPSTVVTTTGSQTLTNKTLTSPVISQISNTGTLTLPTATDTLVGRATTDTLTNKTIVAANNTITTAASGNLAATTLNAALAELQGDIDTLARLACQGRPTLESGVSASTTDQIGKSTLYFAPHGGNLIGLYDGTRWGLHTFTERSLSLSGLISSGQIKDGFIYNNAGTLTLELSAAWASDTARTDALALQDGVLVKSGAPTRRWIGTIRGTGSGTTEDSQSKRFVWSKYNQVNRYLSVLDTTNHTYTTLNTTRQYRNQAANQIDFVLGEGQSGIQVFTYMSVSQGASEYGVVSFGVDSTTSEYRVYLSVAAGDFYQGHPEAISLGLGRHFLAMVQRSLTASPDYVAASVTAIIQG